MELEDVLRQQTVVDNAFEQAIATGDWEPWHQERKKHGEIIEAWSKAHKRDFRIREILELLDEN